MTTAQDELLAAAERMERTEEGWIEKVTHPAHGRMVTRMVLLLARLGVPEDCLFDNTRLGPDADGLRYVPDLMVVLPDNPVPVDDLQDYAGAPDLVVEVLSPGDANRARDLEEKRRRYAMRGVNAYWIAEPETGQVIALRLTRSLADPNRRWYPDRAPVPMDLLRLPWRR